LSVLRRGGIPLLALAAACAAGSCASSGPWYRGAPAGVAPLAADEVDHRLILVGDAGDPDPEDRLGGLLARQAGALASRTTVVFLGDNIYPAGLPGAGHPEREEAQRRLDAQLDALKDSRARGRFVPGNHDWDNAGAEGMARVEEQGAYIERRSRDEGFDARSVPAHACPGPVAEALGERGELIALDTPWWLHEHSKPSPVLPGDCAAVEAEVVEAELTTRIDAAEREGRSVLVVAHHPLATHGPHGGHFGLRAHAVPIFGSIYVLVRRYGSPSAQDLSNEANRHMRERLEAALRAAGGVLVYAAGHDHSLQVLEGGAEDGAEFLVVSGSGSRSGATAVGSGDATLFAYSSPDHPGFVVVDLARDGRVRLSAQFWDAASPLGRELYSRFLASGSRRLRRARQRRCSARRARSATASARLASSTPALRA
jgi:hypothetical protein